MDKNFQEKRGFVRIANICKESTRKFTGKLWYVRTLQYKDTKNITYDLENMRDRTFRRNFFATQQIIALIKQLLKLLSLMSPLTSHQLLLTSSSVIFDFLTTFPLLVCRLCTLAKNTSLFSIRKRTYITCQFYPVKRNWFGVWPHWKVVKKVVKSQKIVVPTTFQQGDTTNVNLSCCPSPKHEQTKF